MTKSGKKEGRRKKEEGEGRGSGEEVERKPLLY